MLNFLEWFPCVLWVCACGHSLSFPQGIAHSTPENLPLHGTAHRIFSKFNFHRRPQLLFTSRGLVGESGCILMRSILGVLSKQSKPRRLCPVALEVWCKAHKASCERQDDDRTKRSQAQFSCCPFACKISFCSH